MCDIKQTKIFTGKTIMGGLVFFISACSGNNTAMGDDSTESASYQNETQTETVANSGQETTETDNDSGLPEEWTGAEIVAHYVSRNLEQWDESADQILIGAAVRNGEALLVIENDRYFMGEYYQVYRKMRSAKECDILIQFENIEVETMPFFYEKFPVNVFRAKIGHLHNEDIVRIFRRDNTEYRNDDLTRLVGETVIQVDGDCLPLFSCNSNSDCPYLDLDGEYVHKCQSVPGCSGNKCAWDDEVAWLSEL